MPGRDGGKSAHMAAGAPALGLARALLRVDEHVARLARHVARERRREEPRRPRDFFRPVAPHVNVVEGAVAAAAAAALKELTPGTVSTL